MEKAALKTNPQQGKQRAREKRGERVL